MDGDDPLLFLQRTSVRLGLGHKATMEDLDARLDTLLDLELQFEIDRLETSVEHRMPALATPVPIDPGWYLVRMEDVGEVAEWGPKVGPGRTDDLSGPAREQSWRLWAARTAGIVYDLQMSDGDLMEAVEQKIKSKGRSGW